MSNDLPQTTASFHALAQQLKAVVNHRPFALQIGAMDGVKFDLLHPHLIVGGWVGLLIEPVPDMYVQLRETYKACPDLEFANSAVADVSGFMTLRRVDPEAVTKGLIPEEALGITSSFLERSVLSHPKFSQAFPEVVKDYIRDIHVPCFRLEDLLHQHQVTRIDLVMIDTEGADWLIAQQLNLDQFAPSLVCLEYTSLPDTEVEACCRHFSSHGYQAGICAEDKQNLIFYKAVLHENAP